MSRPLSTAVANRVAREAQAEALQWKARSEHLARREESLREAVNLTVGWLETALIEGARMDSLRDKNLAVAARTHRDRLRAACSPDEEARPR